MKSIEFESQLTSPGQIQIPAGLAGDLPPGTQVRVIQLWDREGDDWQAATQERFASAYVAEDSVYERLIDESPAR